MISQRHRAHGHAVVSEIDEFAAAHDAYHPLAGSNATDEGGHKAYHEGHHAQVAKGCAESFLGYLDRIKQCLAQNGGNHHQEGELRHVGFVVAEDKSRGDGRTAATQTGQDGHGLCNTYNKGVNQGDALLLSRFAKVGIGQQTGGHEQAAAHHEQGQIFAENAVHGVLEEDADHEDGNHRHQDIQHVALVGIETGQSARASVERAEGATHQAENLTAQHHKGTQHGGHVNGHDKHEVCFGFDAKDMATDGQVAATADGQIFGQTLQETENQCFKCFQLSKDLELFLLGLVLFALLCLGLVQNGVDDEQVAEEAYHGGHLDATGTEDVGIEYIEGAARARHENQAKNNSGHANAQQDKVHAVKGENSFLFHICWLFD